MPKEPISVEKTKNTFIVLGLVNLLASPLYFFDARLGLTASIALTATALHKFNEIGKARRPGSNLINRANNFLAPYTGDSNTDWDNTVRNVVNGGDAVCTQIFPRSTH